MSYSPVPTPEGTKETYWETKAPSSEVCACLAQSVCVPKTLAGKAGSGAVHGIVRGLAKSGSDVVPCSQVLGIGKDVPAASFAAASVVSAIVGGYCTAEVGRESSWMQPCEYAPLKALVGAPVRGSTLCVHGILVRCAGLGFGDEGWGVLERSRQVMNLMLKLGLGSGRAAMQGFMWCEVGNASLLVRRLEAALDGLCCSLGWLKPSALVQLAACGTSSGKIGRCWARAGMRLAECMCSCAWALQAGWEYG
jgi:hypothetical protein